MLQITIPNDNPSTLSNQTITVRISHDLLIVIASFMIAVVGYFFTEKIPIGNGLGWDGQVYGALAKGEFLNPGESPLDRYRIQRILPSIIVFTGLKLFRMALTDQHILASFGLLNIFCITSVGWCWIKTATLMSISSRGKWLGFCALILNFAVAKHTSYYPVLTDIPAYAIGCWMLYFYMSRSYWSLFLITGLGAFVWPLLMFQGSLLLLFPRPVSPTKDSCQSATVRFPRSGLNVCFAGLVTFYLLVAIHWSVGHAHLPICGCITPSTTVFPLSIEIVAVYVFFILMRMIDVAQCVEALVGLLVRDWRRLVALILMIGTIRVIYATWAPLTGNSGAKQYLLFLFIKSVYKPGVFLLGHAVYFGPIIPLVVLLWTRVSREIQQTGIGISLAMTMGLLLSLDGESRHLNHAFPLIVPFAILAIERLKWNMRHTMTFVGFSAFASKFWMTINSPGFESGSNMLEFPMQGYTMNYGVLMNNQTYVIQGTIALAMTLFLFQFIRSSESANTQLSVNRLRDDPSARRNRLTWRSDEEFFNEIITSQVSGKTGI